MWCKVLHESLTSSKTLQMVDPLSRLISSSKQERFVNLQKAIAINIAPPNQTWRDTACIFNLYVSFSAEFSEFDKGNDALTRVH